MLTITQVDFNNPQHCDDLLRLLNNYALDPMGGGEALSAYAQENLIRELSQRNIISSFIAFACKPLLNIHDFAVNPEFRGRGIAKALLNAIDELARAKGCCKITLEVLQGNLPAKQLYEAMGFAVYELDPEMGGALFMQKKLEGK
jgi:GNAT superfamily N-acetyltransferase